MFAYPNGGKGFARSTSSNFSLAEGNRRPSWFFDSETLVALRDVAIEKLLRAAIVRVERSRGRMTSEERAELEQDLQLAKAPRNEQQQLANVLDILGDLPLAETTRRENLSKREIAALNRASRPDPLRPSRRPGSSLRSGEADPQMAKVQADLRRLGVQRSSVDPEARTDRPAASPATERPRFQPSGRPGNSLRDCILLCWCEVDQWVVSELGAILRGPEVTYAELREGERWILEPGIRPHLASDVARAHVTMAQRLARHSLAATVALVHLSRAVELGLPASSRSLVEAKTLAEATRAATPRPALQLRLTCEPDVDPQIEIMVAAALRSVLMGTENALSALTTYATRSDQPTLTVRILKADLVADFSGVSTVSSSYLSHYQRVPNPRKRSLEFACDLAKSWAESAEYSYESALRSHNIYPTEWSLISVNNAYNNYVRAVDDYNFKVNLYNSTPSTIEEPVFMPYSFRQGTVRFGWRVAAHISAPGVGSIHQQHESIATDFMRIGAKVTDRTETYRRNDSLDIDISPEAGLNRLFKVAEEIRDSMQPGLGKLAFQTTAVLEPEQQTILAWLHHPLGIQKSLAEELGVPEWASQCVNPADLLSTLHRAEPPEVLVPGCRATQEGRLSAEAALLGCSRPSCARRAHRDASPPAPAPER